MVPLLRTTHLKLYPRTILNRREPNVDIKTPRHEENLIGGEKIWSKEKGERSMKENPIKEDLASNGVQSQLHQSTSTPSSPKRCSEEQEQGSEEQVQVPKKNH